MTISLKVQFLPNRHTCWFSAILLLAASIQAAAGTPTDGFVAVPYFHYIQSPYDLPLSDRYSVTNGTNYFWVYSTDQPFQPSSTTAPRTEMRIFNDYTNGVWQFEGDLYVPSGTTGVAVMQVFGGATSATSCQLRIYNGSLCRYTTPIRGNIHDSWIHVNVIHDADAHTVAVYLNGAFIRSDPDRGPATYYFKCGVYAQDNPSSRMEARWANVKVWRRVPKIWRIAKGASGVVLSVTNGTPGAVCDGLASPNLATPVEQWARVATATFDRNGSVVLVDSEPLGNNPARWYRVQVP